VLAEVKRQNKRVSEVCHCFEPLPQVLRSVRAQKKMLEKDSVTVAIDSARQKLGNAGRVVVRPSGTEPVIRVMVEAAEAETAKAEAEMLAAAVRAAAA